MKQKSNLKLIYKIHSKLLKQHKWNLNLPFDEASRSYSDSIVAISDSQVLRWISEINGVIDQDEKINEIKRRISAIKKRPRSRENTVVIKQLYLHLHNLQFQKDYICVIMDSKRDYDKANQGFTVNGIKFRRFLGTNGGIKNSTIVYVNEKLYPELKKRLDNGRKMDVPLVPAKLEAYQALVCSGSTPLPEPKGFIVVRDCITHFKDDVILIDDSCDGEPILTYEDGYEIEHNDSDGYGLMLPGYSRRVNEYLTGNTTELSGMNTRCAWTKGMVYTFDFVEFAEKVAGTYEIIDVWGHKRDVRDADVILTESMLKLWNCYDSWEDYWRNCQENHYQFSTPKITPEKLENARYTNYQFLQSYDFTDEDIEELCKPSVKEIRDSLGFDWRKSLTFMSGMNLTNDTAFCRSVDIYPKAIMADSRVINDPLIRKKIWGMIQGRIEMAERGAVKVAGNYAMVSGDPYALCQSIFGLEITGLLKAGEIYHKHWIDKGADEVVCFRAPMTCHNNIRKVKLNKSEEVSHWYRYIETASILNAWDTMCDAENGMDKDGDTNMVTDNPVLLKNTLNSRTIVCLQRKASKVVPTEQDIVAANKLAFNDDIGTITNFVTSMFEVQAGFDKCTKEYEALAYRTMCGQNYQQNSIDRAKGIIAKDMPEYWHSVRDNIAEPGDDSETIKQKEFNLQISANKKPYFMVHVYPELKKRYRDYIKNKTWKCVQKFGKYGISSIDDIIAFENKTSEMKDFIKYYYKRIPVGCNPCVVNRISWLFEKEFDGFSKYNNNFNFDYRIYKSGIDYSARDRDAVYREYLSYDKDLNRLRRRFRAENMDQISFRIAQDALITNYRERFVSICTNEFELCDIMLDTIYQKESAKEFVWGICGNTIIKNLLEKNNNTIHYPERVESDGEFEFGGEQFVIKDKVIDIDEYCSFE